jgi:hypothetical protein
MMLATFFLKELFRPRRLRGNMRRRVTTSLNRCGERSEPMTQPVRQDILGNYAVEYAALPEIDHFDISHWDKAQSGPEGETHG